jgi:hypothetical protein
MFNLNSIETLLKKLAAQNENWPTRLEVAAKMDEINRLGNDRIKKEALAYLDEHGIPGKVEVEVRMKWSTPTLREGK